MNEVCSGADGVIDPKCLEIVAYCSEISSRVIIERFSKVVSNVASNVFWGGIGVFHLYTLDKIVKTLRSSSSSMYLPIPYDIPSFFKISGIAKQWLSKDFLASSVVLGTSNLLYLGNENYKIDTQNKKIIDVLFSSLAIAQGFYLLFGLFKQERYVLAISFFFGAASSIYLIEEAVRNAFGYLAQI